VGTHFLAGGMSAALVPMEASLYVAIPCWVLRVALGALAERVSLNLEAVAMSLVTVLASAPSEERPVPVS